MADTVRTKAGLISLYASTGAGTISGQDGRDLISSIMGAYAHLYVTGNSTAQTGIGTGYSTLDWGNGGGDGVDDNAASDYANNQILIGTLGDGDYLVAFQASFSGTASTEFTFSVSLDGTPVTGLACVSDINASSEIVSCSIVGIVTCAAAEVLAVQAKADGASKQVTLMEAQLAVKRLG